MDDKNCERLNGCILENQRGDPKGALRVTHQAGKTGGVPVIGRGCRGPCSHGCAGLSRSVRECWDWLASSAADSDSRLGSFLALTASSLHIVEAGGV